MNQPSEQCQNGLRALGACAAGREAEEACEPCQSEFQALSNSCTGTDLSSTTVLTIRMSCLKDGDQFCEPKLTESGCDKCRQKGLKLIQDEGMMEFYKPMLGAGAEDVDACLQESFNQPETSASWTPTLCLFVLLFNKF